MCRTNILDFPYFQARCGSVSIHTCLYMYLYTFARRPTSITWTWKLATWQNWFCINFYNWSFTFFTFLYYKFRLTHLRWKRDFKVSVSYQRKKNYFITTQPRIDINGTFTSIIFFFSIIIFAADLRKQKYAEAYDTCYQHILSYFKPKQPRDWLMKKNHCSRQC